jgi:hypothetical protein
LHRLRGALPDVTVEEEPIAAVEKGAHGTLDDRPPEAVLGLKTLVVDALEGLEVLIHQAPQA